MNQNARTTTIEVLVNDDEKSSAAALCKVLGIGLSTWYRGLGNAEVRRHGMPPDRPRESRHCRGVGRPASRGAAAMSQRRQV